MLRLLAFNLLICTTLLAADEPQPYQLAAPSGWGGETIKLPPGFAPDMQLKGLEHIRFAPGMMKSASDSFFCYAFVFELQRQPELTDTVVKNEFLKYYRGLCLAVLNGQVPEVKPQDFTLTLQRVKSDKKTEAGADQPTRYMGTLDWVEPFATKKRQKLHLEIQTWAKADRNYLFACVSPQGPDAAIWKKLRTIRDDYLKK